MKITLFIKYEKELPGYWAMQEQGVLKEEKALLYLLFIFFNSYDDSIVMEESNSYTHIWDSLDEDDYDSWEDIPKLTLSNKNYDHLIKQWNLNHEHPAKYLVFTMDDNGWIDLEAKDELSKEDQKLLEQEIQ